MYIVNVGKYKYDKSINKLDIGIHKNKDYRILYLGIIKEKSKCLLTEGYLLGTKGMRLLLIDGKY